MNVGDMVQHYVWDNDVYVITDLRKRDPSTNAFGIELQFIFHKEGEPNHNSSPCYGFLKPKRYVVERIFKREWEIVPTS